MSRQKPVTLRRCCKWFVLFCFAFPLYLTIHALFESRTQIIYCYLYREYCFVISISCAWQVSICKNRTSIIQKHNSKNGIEFVAHIMGIFHVNKITCALLGWGCCRNHILVQFDMFQWHQLDWYDARTSPGNPIAIAKGREAWELTSTLAGSAHRQVRAWARALGWGWCPMFRKALPSRRETWTADKSRLMEMASLLSDPSGCWQGFFCAFHMVRFGPTQRVLSLLCERGFSRVKLPWIFKLSQTCPMFSIFRKKAGSGRTAQEGTISIAWHGWTGYNYWRMDVHVAWRGSYSSEEPCWTRGFVGIVHVLSTLRSWIASVSLKLEHRFSWVQRIP